METLVTAVLIVAGFIVVAFVLFTASEMLEAWTGKDLQEWFWVIVNTGFFLAIGYGGYRLVRWGMNDDSVGIVIVGIVIMALAGLVIYAVWITDR